MASLISAQEKAELGIIFADIFDTFKRDITVHKEPQQVVENIDVNHIFGYGAPSQNQNITYIPRSKTFSATITYKMMASDTVYVPDISSFVPGDLVKIKVEQATRDYIINGGTTEYVEFDNKRFNLVSDDIESNFLGVCFHIFFLRVAK
tara:strand:+ start:531 stop:977 length:447 start_codon:yes stop_codon:yes gene_type:complete